MQECQEAAAAQRAKSAAEAAAKEKCLIVVGGGEKMEDVHYVGDEIGPVQEYDLEICIQMVGSIHIL